MLAYFATRVRLRTTVPAVAVPLPVRVGLTAGFGAFVVLYALFAIWVHHCFEGRYHGPFLPSEVFGVPDAARANGVAPVMPNPIPGWDGQFYFHMANDPLGRADTARHLDNPSYRYQRIGVPAAAWAVGRLFGHRYTPAFLYHLIQLAAVAVGFGLLAGWLVRYDRPWWYALGWLAGVGPGYALMYGLPDPVGDAGFVATLCFLWNRRLIGYAVAATALCLVREGYVVVPFFVWLATVTNRWTWNTSAGYLRRFVLTALPGAAVVGWALYLSVQFGVSLTSPERNTPGIYDWPFRAAWGCLADYFREGNTLTARYLLTELFTVLTVLAVTLRAGRTHRAAWFAVPFVALALCLGRIVWECPQGYFKTAGSCLALGVFLLPFDRSHLLRFAMAANVLLGVEWNLIANVFAPPWYPSDVRYQEDFRGDRPKTVGESLTDFGADVVWLDPVEEFVPASGRLWRWTHRETMSLRVRVTNRGPLPWRSDVGTNRVEVGTVLFDGTGQPVSMAVTGLDPPLPPGEFRELDVPLRLPKPGRYTVMIGVTLDRRVWFHNETRTPAAAFPVRIR